MDNKLLLNSVRALKKSVDTKSKDIRLRCVQLYGNGHTLKLMARTTKTKTILSLPSDITVDAMVALDEFVKALSVAGDEVNIIMEESPDGWGQKLLVKGEKNRQYVNLANYGKQTFLTTHLPDNPLYLEFLGESAKDFTQNDNANSSQRFVYVAKHPTTDALEMITVGDEVLVTTKGLPRTRKFNAVADTELFDILVSLCKLFGDAEVHVDFSDGVSFEFLVDGEQVAFVKHSVNTIVPKLEDFFHMENLELSGNPVVLTTTRGDVRKLVTGANRLPTKTDTVFKIIVSGSQVTVVDTVTGDVSFTFPHNSVVDKMFEVYVSYHALKRVTDGHTSKEEITLEIRNQDEPVVVSYPTTDLYIKTWTP